MATLYWYGGSGTWSDYTNHWSNNSGNSPSSPAAAVPTSSDNVVFDANSGTGTLTIGAVANCLDFDAANTSILTFTGSSYNCNIYGDFLLKTGVTFGLNVSLYSTAADSVITCYSTPTYQVVIRGTGTYTLGCNFAITSTLGVSKGGFDTNDYSLSAYTLESIGNETRSIDLGASTVTLQHSSSIIFSGTNLTFDAGTSNINITGGTGSFTGGGKTFYNVRIYGLNAFTTFFLNSDNCTFNNLTINSPGSAVTKYSFPATTTVNGTFTVTGSASTRIYIGSSTVGTQSTINAAAVSLEYVDFQDISAGGAAEPFTGTSLGDGGNNTDITFTHNSGTDNATGGVYRYWVATSGGSSNATSSWSETSGGASGASLPLIHDTIVFDSNSITSASRTITFVQGRYPGLDFSSVTNSPALSWSGEINLFGELDLTGLRSSSNASVAFSGRVNFDLITNGFTLNNVTMVNYNCTATVIGDLAASGLYLYDGIFDANDNDITASNVYGNSARSHTLYMGNGTWTLTGTYTIWNSFSNFTIYCEGSTILVNNATTTSKYIYTTSTDVFNIITIASDNVRLNTTNVTVGTLNLNTKGKTNGTIFQHGYTATVTNFTCDGESGSLCKIRSTSSTTNATLAKSGGGKISTNYVDIDYITGSPASTWYVGSNSTDGGHNSNIYFSSPSDTSSRGFYLKGVSSNNSQRGLYLIGKTSNSSSRAFYLRGISTATSNRVYHLRGRAFGATSRNFHLEGITKPLYSKESSNTLKADISALENSFSSQDYAKVLTNDNDFSIQAGEYKYITFLFAEPNLKLNNTDSLALTWVGKSDIAPSVSAVLLQIYNHSTDEWDTVDSDNATAVDTKFTLSGNITTDLANYYDANYYIYCRVYQDIS